MAREMSRRTNCPSARTTPRKEEEKPIGAKRESGEERKIFKSRGRQDGRGRGGYDYLLLFFSSSYSARERLFKRRGDVFVPQPLLPSSLLFQKASIFRLSRESQVRRLHQSNVAQLHIVRKLQLCTFIRACTYIHIRIHTYTYTTVHLRSASSLPSPRHEHQTQAREDILKATPYMHPDRPVHGHTYMSPVSRVSLQVYNTSVYFKGCACDRDGNVCLDLYVQMDKSEEFGARVHTAFPAHLPSYLCYTKYTDTITSCDQIPIFKILA